ncbi:S-adenosyl-L-methionine-dependent methyltransferase, partial [Dendrothele bispora CBS 962.96]
MNTVHHQSAKGYSEKSSEYYDKARPSYPPAVYSYIRQTVGTNNKALKIVEIAAGTGIFTRGLLNSPEWYSDIDELKAVEPSAGMRETFSKAITEDKVTLSEGTFESIGVPDGWADMIVIATVSFLYRALHWCFDFDKAVLEFCRVLKPEGFVFFVWNTLSRNRAPWITKLWDIANRYDPEGLVSTERWRLSLFDSSEYQKRMELVEEWVFQHDPGATSDTVIRRVLSWSAISPLDEKEKDDIRNEILEILKGREKVDWIDESAGVFKLPHDSLVVTIQLAGS